MAIMNRRLNIYSTEPVIIRQFWPETPGKNIFPLREPRRATIPLLMAMLYLLLLIFIGILASLWTIRPVIKIIKNNVICGKLHWEILNISGSKKLWKKVRPNINLFLRIMFWEQVVEE